MAAFFLLSQCIFLPLLPSKAAAETRVTITFAAGGVACGIFFFLRFGFRSSLLQQYQNDATALFNGGPDGWEIYYPSVNIIPDEERKITYPNRSGETMQMDLLKFRF
jgi:hypothetical protein